MGTELSPLTTEQREKLTRIQRFLINVTDTDVSAVATRAGYDDEEHREGWSLWETAAGTRRPFDHFLTAEARRATASLEAPSLGRIQALDAFENTWFPRARNGIRRFVDPAQRDAFERAFFADMPQQPEGPAVVGSVDRLLGRLESLRRSDVPGAAAAWRALQKKGLTDEVLAQTAALVAAAKGSAAAEAPAPDAEQVRRDSQAQVAAFEQLVLWFNDWAETLRPSLSYHQQLRLGLKKVKAAAKAEGPVDA
jgi:hypothetical protein